MGDYREGQICPSCGEELLHGDDEVGETFQCTAMDCLQLFDADEIITAPPNAKSPRR